MTDTLEGYIARFSVAREAMDKQIKWLERGGSIAPAGADDAQTVQATALWRETLTRYRYEYDEIVTDLGRRATTS